MILDEVVSSFLPVSIGYLAIYETSNLPLKIISGVKLAKEAKSNNVFVKKWSKVATFVSILAISILSGSLLLSL